VTTLGGVPGYYLKIGRTAMACQFEVYLRPRDRALVPAVHEALDEIDGIEAQLSVYRDSSEVSHLNRAAASAPVAVEPRLYRLIALARALGHDTGGAFDLTAGPLVRCWGFLERRGRIPDPETLRAAREQTGWDKLVLDDAAGSVAFSRQGVELNFAAIGKGYALDRAAESLRRAGLRSFLLHAGHSSIVAAGDSNQGPGWEVSLRDPRAHERSLGTLRLEDEALSTSGIGEQSFVAEGRRYGHILDPRTGQPAAGCALASVLAPQAAVAEALSTAFFVMSPGEVESYCHNHSYIGSILVTLDTPQEGTAGGAVLVTGTSSARFARAGALV
jgi:thiamine biosynthesis lipoprotein